MKLWRYGSALERLGQRYRLDGVLGSGGMADVCLAWDEHDGRNVAIKVIKPQELDQLSLDRFLKEASQVARWRHPNILRVYGDARLELLDGTQGSVVPYIVMEYAQNGDLHKRLHPGMPYAFAETLIVFEQLCRAVAYAHAQGIIHRDLKPLNILFRALPSGAEQVVLSDFGLAVEQDASHFTYAAGGTLPYMSPEQLRGQAAPASDIFALGVILYQLCTGRLPFRRSIADLRQHRPSPIPPLPSEVYKILPPDLDAVIMRALDDDPRRRYPNALQFWDAVHAVIDARTITAITRHESQRQNPGARSQPTAPIRKQPSASSGPHVTKVFSAIERSQSALPYDVATRHIDRQGSGAMARLDDPQSDASNHIQASNYPITQPRASLIPNTGPHTKIPSRSNTNTSRPSHTTPSHPPVKPRTRWNWLIVGSALLSISLIIVIVASVLHVAPFDHLWPGQTNIQPTVIITLEPLTTSIDDSTTIQVTTQNPNTSNQVTGHPITETSQPQTQTVQGTGQKQTKGTVAKGMLTFFNGSFTPFSVSTSIPISGPNGTQFLTDGPFTILAANPDTSRDGEITVPAHATTAGTQGNIQPLGINQTCCTTTGNYIAVKNTNVFTGGQDPQNYTFIQQSDIDAAATPIENTEKQQVINALNSQVATGDVLKTESIKCHPTLKTDQPIGDKGHTITSTQLSVTFTCSGTSYNKEAVQKLAQARVEQKATSTLGKGYVLDSTTTSVEVTVPTNTDDGTLLSLSTTSKSTWHYQISTAQQQLILQEIVGKTVSEAQQIAQQQPGIANMKVTIVRGDKTILPDDPAKIRIQTQ